MVCKSILCLLGFASLLGTGSLFHLPLADAAESASPALMQSASSYPPIEIREENGNSHVYWGDQLIVELKGNRYLRFRATPLDEKWVGSERKGADLCWAYADPQAKGLEVLATAHEHNPQKGEFLLSVKARKPHFESNIRYSLKGTWMPQLQKFKYVLSSSIHCPLELWHQNARTNPAGHSSVEVTDYHIEYVSAPDRNMAPNHREPQMYEWFVKSPDGKDWQKFPKVHIPYPTRRGNYITIHDSADPTTVGGYYGFIDLKHGGWMSRLTKSSFPISYGLCWMFFDVHIIMPGAVPPRGSAENLSLQYEAEFVPVSAQEGLEIISKADELPWRAMPEYALPLFSRDNRFDKILPDLPSEQTADQYIWWASSFDCYRDDTTGFDDNFSVTINRREAGPMPAAWNTFCWGRPFEMQSSKNRRYRLSAMVKTRECTGTVRLIFAYAHTGDIFYGVRTHDPDGKPLSDGRVTWQFSGALTGTNDWTPLTLEFTVKENINSLILEQHGPGQSWFDNVKLEDLGEASQ